MAPELKQHHVVIFPYMAQGHIIPLIDLSKALAKRGVRVTMITTPSNAPSIAQATSKYSLISLIEIPFPNNTNLPKGVENTSQLPSMAYLVPFLQATKQLKEPFDQVLEEMKRSNDLPICVISDFFLGWTFESCQAFGVPRLVFHGMSVLAMAIIKSAWEHAEKIGTIESSQPLIFKGMNLPFALTGADLPLGVGSQNHDDPFNRAVAEVIEGELNSWGIIVNSFSELEQDYIYPFERFFKEGTKAWCLGPLSLYGDNDKNTCSLTNDRYQNEMVMTWLDKFQTIPNSVIYVSFGTQAEVSDAQLDEVAYGLGASGVPFVWVVRSEKWDLPIEIAEKVKDNGLLVRNWVDQRSILAHSAIGAFISHCGWNSVLESVSCGVPILAWPLIAEQALNAKFVTEGLGAGIRVHKYIENAAEKCDGLVGREAVCRGVRELMKGCKGGNAREKAKALGRIARMAVEEGGSSYDTLGDLIYELSNYKK